MNKVILSGHLGRDPEFKTTPNGKEVATFPLASNDYVNGERKTEWHRVVLLGGVVQVARQYIKKGSEISVEGRNQTRKYEKDGQTHYITEVVCFDMEMHGSGQQAQTTSPTAQQPAQPRQPAKAQPSQNKQQPQKQAAPAANTAGMNDEIPF